MKVIIEIPNYEFDDDVKDRFQDYFNRVKADIADGTVCGNYELETTEMFLASFERMQVLPDIVTNGQVLKALFEERIYNALKDRMQHTKWWGTPYKRGVENESVD